MDHVAKLFTKGRSQAAHLPAAYRFDSKEVFIHRDPETGDVILSRTPTTWDSSFLATLKGTNVPADFLNGKERHCEEQGRDPFEGWDE